MAVIIPDRVWRLEWPFQKKQAALLWNSFPMSTVASPFGYIDDALALHI